MSLMYLLFRCCEKLYHMCVFSFALVWIHAMLICKCILLLYVVGDLEVGNKTGIIKCMSRVNL